jgi:hypothetical protein
VSIYAERWRNSSPTRRARIWGCRLFLPEFRSIKVPLFLYFKWPRMLLPWCSPRLHTDWQLVYPTPPVIVSLYAWTVALLGVNQPYNLLVDNTNSGLKVIAGGHENQKSLVNSTVGIPHRRHLFSISPPTPRANRHIGTEV